VVVFRKVFMSALAVFFAFNYRAQGLFALIVIFSFIIGHARALPFTNEKLNLLEGLSLSNTALTFFCGQFTFFKDSESDQRNAKNATIIAAISNIAFIIGACGYLLLVTFQDLKRAGWLLNICSSSQKAGAVGSSPSVGEAAVAGPPALDVSGIELDSVPERRKSAQERFVRDLMKQDTREMAEV